jgi:5'-nucleotidase
MSTKPKPLILATNDDGINSKFLIRLVEALSQECEVVTCAPDGERSWIGHAITRHQTLEPKKLKKYPGKEAYSVNGTPADCVNLAVGNLLEREPDVVVSGINLGYNVTMPMILSSGTVGAAMEGSLLGLRSMAVSLALPNEEFDQIRKSGGKVKGAMAKTLGATAESAAKYAQTLATLPVPDGLTVHNLNYPISYKGEDDPMLTFANSLKLNSLFDLTEDGKSYQLTYKTEWLDNAKIQVGSDLWALQEGMASISRLDFSEASGKRYLEP